jgi:hypothetical protein
VLDRVGFSTGIIGTTTGHLFGLYRKMKGLVIPPTSLRSMSRVSNTQLISSSLIVCKSQVAPRLLAGPERRAASRMSAADLPSVVVTRLWQTIRRPMAAEGRSITTVSPSEASKTFTIIDDREVRVTVSPQRLNAGAVCITSEQ